VEYRQELKKKLRDYVFDHRFESNGVVEAGVRAEKDDALRAIDLAIQRVDKALGESGLGEAARRVLGGIGRRWRRKRKK